MSEIAHKSDKPKEGGSVKRQRTCVVCRSQADKVTLYRVVRGKDGAVDFDPSGRVAGRGAYLCSRECFEKARSSKRLERALKTTMKDDDYERIAHDLDVALRGLQG